MVRSKILAVAIALLLALPLALGSSSTAFADTKTGWIEIIPALTDGKGDEFVRNETYLLQEHNVTSYPVEFNGTEWQQVMEAFQWVQDHIDYTYEPVDTWTSSDQIYEQIDPDWDGADLGLAYDDCDGYAILLCALMRSNINVSEERVWVACCAIHAVVQYITPEGAKLTLDPTNNIIRRGGAPRQIVFNDEMAVYHGPPLSVFLR